jgi:para-aminobenzoate synthetase/4-amino-4-deoxychorismate lyase
LAAAPGGGRCKVRLLLSAEGAVSMTMERLSPRSGAPAPARVALAVEAIDSREPLLYHKTTWRPWYDGVLERYPGCLDILFCNARGEVTEGTLHNLVMEKAGRLVTPPVACGLLPGTLRQELLESGVLVEEVITRRELLVARRLWLINSVRGWRRVTMAAAGGIEVK